MRTCDQSVAGILGRLTIFIQEQLIKAQATGLLANEAVHMLRAVVIDSDGVLKRLDAGLKTERDLGVSNRVPVCMDRRAKTSVTRLGQLRCSGIESAASK